MNDRARPQQMQIEDNRSAREERDNDPRRIKKDDPAIRRLQLAGTTAKPVKRNPAQENQAEQGDQLPGVGIVSIKTCPGKYSRR